MEINIRECLGMNFGIEDAIVLRDKITNSNDKNITLNFEGINIVPATFFNCLFGENLYKGNRKEIFEKISVKNLSNTRDYSRVVLGTAFVH